MNPQSGAADDLENIYSRRFDEEDTRRKDQIWREIGRYLQRFIPTGGRVLDLACDKGYLIRHVEAGERWASDIRDVSPHLGAGIEFVQSSGLELGARMPTEYFDVVFTSNYLEHLHDSHAVVRQLEVAAALLRRGGRMVILQPNIRHVGAAYWDFIDHHVALTERSLQEAAEIAGFRTDLVVTRFLPYTTKQRLPQSALLVKAYLAFPPAWRLFGKQTLYVGVKP